MDKKKLDDFVKKVEDSANEALEDTLLDKEASSESTKDYSYDDIVKISTKDRMSKLPWLISIFLILTISLAFGYMFFKGNPQTIFINTVDSFFSFLNDNISGESYDISNSKMSLDVVFSGYGLDSQSINMDIDYTLDRTNSLSKYKIVNRNNNAKFDIYSDKKNLYVYPKGIYDGYIKYSDAKNVSSIKVQDIKPLLSGINQAFDKVAADEKITGEKVNYDLGNKTIRVYQSSLIIDSKNYVRASETFVNTLKSNNDFVSSLADLLKISSDEVKVKLDNFLPKLKNYLKSNEKAEIKLYTDRKNNEFIKGEIICKNQSISFVKDDDDAFTIKFNSELLSGDVSLKVNKKRLILNINVDGIIKINGKVDVVSKKVSSFGKYNMDNIVDEKDISEDEKNNIYSKLFGNDFIKLLKDTNS